MMFYIVLIEENDVDNLWEPTLISNKAVCLLFNNKENISE